MNDEKLVQLYEYCRQDLPIFPLAWIDPRTGGCSCGVETCTSPGKHPLLPGGFKAATTNPATVGKWHSKWPHANWGMRTGTKVHGGSGVLVVDIDTKRDGVDGFGAWEALAAQDIEGFDTVTVVTGNQGLHYWFQYPEGQEIPCSAGVLGAGLDIRAEGGYVLVPPSATSNPYLFDPGLDEVGVSPTPDWLLGALNGAGCGDRSGQDIKPLVGLVPEGERHQKLLVFGASLRKLGFGREEIRGGLCLLRDRWFEPGDHPVTDEEIDGVVNWLGRNVPHHNLTDTGNAIRFREQHSDELIYDYRRRGWIVWDGKRWVVGDQAGAETRLMRTIETIHVEAITSVDQKTQAKIAKHAMNSEAAYRNKAALRLARPMLCREDLEFDRHQDKINALNGVVDLVTGELLPHNKHYYFTRLIHLDYDPGAEAPFWVEFLDMVTQGDSGMQRYLQRAVGYTLLGYTDEQCLFYVYGDGANGKTTFVEAIRECVGELAERVAIEALIDARNSGPGPRPAIVRINGARMVLTSEVPFAKKLNESLVKELTGGDSITARGMYQSDITFKPTHKLWVVGNHKPVIVGTDEGILRRFQMIPFVYQIPPEKRLPQRLVKKRFCQEAVGIFTWAVRGSVGYMREGLPKLGTVDRATREFRDEVDLVGQFILDRCLEGEELKVAKTLLYSEWRAWCEGNGEFESLKRSRRWFIQQLTKRGFIHYGDGHRMLNGLGLRP